MPEHPHLSLPFRFNTLRGGGLEIAVTEQDTTDEIADCVELVCRTEETERPTLPSFGRPRLLLFTTHHETARSMLQQKIDEAEPRVQAIVERDAAPVDEAMFRLLAMYNLAIEEWSPPA